MITRAALKVAGNGAIAGVAGFLMRPCCVIPAALSIFGVGGAVVGQAVAEYRGVLFSISVALLAASMWMTCRTQGALPAKAIAGGATILAFVFFWRF